VIEWLDVEKEMPELPIIREAKTREEMIQKVKPERLKEIILKLKEWKVSPAFVAHFFRKSRWLIKALLDQLCVERWTGRKLPTYPVISDKPFKAPGKVNGIETIIIGVIPTPKLAYVIGWIVGDGAVRSGTGKLNDRVVIYQSSLDLIPVIAAALRPFGTPILYWQLGFKGIGRFGKLLEGDEEKALHEGEKLYAQGKANIYTIYLSNVILARLCSFRGRWRRDVLKRLLRDWTLGGYFCAGLWDADGSVRGDGFPYLRLTDFELLKLLFTSFKKLGVNAKEPKKVKKHVDVVGAIKIRSKRDCYYMPIVGGKPNWRKWGEHTGLKMRHPEKLKHVIT